MKAAIALQHGDDAMDQQPTSVCLTLMPVNAAPAILVIDGSMPKDPPKTPASHNGPNPTGKDAASKRDAGSQRRQPDERDIDQLLASLTDTQIASLFGMSELEVSELRISRQRMAIDRRKEQQKKD